MLIQAKLERLLFEKYGLDENVVLDEDEFLKVMVEILKKLEPEKKHIEVAEEGFKRFDFNNNQKLEFNEFFEFIRFIISEKGYDL